MHTLYFHQLLFGKIQLNKNLQSKRVRLTLKIEEIHANKDHELKPRREHKQDKIRRSIVTCHDIGKPAAIDICLNLGFTALLYLKME